MTERIDTDTDTADLRALLDGVAAGVTPQTDAAWASIEARLRDPIAPLPSVAVDGTVGTDEPVELDVPLAAVDGRAARWHRRRAVLAVAAAVAVVAGVVGVLAAERGEQRPADERRDVYPKLTYVPDGLEESTAGVFEGFIPQSTPGDAALVLESADGMRSYVVEARIGLVDTLFGPRQDIDLGNGRIGRRTTTGSPSVLWQEQRLTVDVAATGLAPADDSELVRVAQGVRVVRQPSLATTLEATVVPDGFRVAWQGSPGELWPTAQADVSFTRRGDLAATTDPYLAGTVFVMSPGVPPVAWAGVGREVTVQGHRGVLAGDGMGPPAVGFVPAITWSPAPGVLASVSGNGLTAGELLLAANGMRFVSEATFRAENPSAGPETLPADPPPADTPVAEGTAGTSSWRLLATGVKGCYSLSLGGGIAQVCGEGAGATRLGRVISVPLDDGHLVLLLPSGDPATVVAEVDDREVARGVAPEAMAAGRSERVVALLVPGSPSSVMLRTLEADGTEQDRVVWQLSNGSPQPQGSADPDALKAAPVLASGTIDGSTPWVLRGGDIPEVVFGANGMEPSGRTLPCVALSLGAREFAQTLCEGEGSPDSVLGASDAVLSSEPRNSVVAFVYDSVRSYRLTYADGRTVTLETVAVPGLTGRRAVAFVVGRDEHLVGLIPVRADGSEGPAIPVDMPGTAQTTFRLGDKAALYGADDESPGDTVTPTASAP